MEPVVSPWIQTPEQGWGSGCHPKNGVQEKLLEFFTFIFSPLLWIFKLAVGDCHTPDQEHLLTTGISLEFSSLQGFSSWIPHGASSRRAQMSWGSPKGAWGLPAQEIQSFFKKYMV